MASTRCQGASMSSPRAHCLPQNATGSGLSKSYCVSSSSRSFQRKVCTPRSSVRLVSAAVLASSAMKALEHVEEIILATTGTWSCSRSRLCQR